MEVILELVKNSSVQVVINGKKSHEFEFDALSLEQFYKNLQDKPNERDRIIQEWGSRLFQIVFNNQEFSFKQFREIEFLNLVCIDPTLQAIPWELMNQDGDFITCQLSFVRCLPLEERNTYRYNPENLHIIGIFSSPLSDDITPLNCEKEWDQLSQDIEQLEFPIVLERCNPPTLAKMRSLITGKKGIILHFNGHGGQEKDSGFLCFEKKNGSLDKVFTKDFLSYVENIPLLIDLNACVSATSGQSEMNNIAFSLIKNGITYALGMQFPIFIDDANLFSKTFYSELARGNSVENSVRQARLELTRNGTLPWAADIPVLYSSIKSPLTNIFLQQKGKPVIKDNNPVIDLFQLPAIEGGFKGRNDEMVQLGNWLTDSKRSHLITIHAGPGMGKTSLARQAAQRFAYAFPGGVYAISMDKFTTFQNFLDQLITLFNGPIAANTKEAKELVLHLLSRHDVLLILDNFETVLQKADISDKEAISAINFIKNQLRATKTSFLLTSWELTNWTEEKVRPLIGLSDKFGAQLFEEWVPHRKEYIDFQTAKEISRQVGGHPISLRLLGGAFNSSPSMNIQSFLSNLKEVLANAQERYSGEDDRHRSLYACFEASLEFLNNSLKELLFKLQLIPTALPIETIAKIINVDQNESDDLYITIDQINTLHEKGWLSVFMIRTKKGFYKFYQIPEAIKLYLEHYHPLLHDTEKLNINLANSYYDIVRFISNRYDLEELPHFLIQIIYPEISKIDINYFKDKKHHFLSFLGQSLWHAGIWQPGLDYLLQSLRGFQEVGDRSGEASTLNNIGGIYHSIGLQQKALAFFNLSLLISKEIGDRSGEATTLNNVGLIYQSIGQPQKALVFFEQALPIMQETEHRGGQATTLHNIGMVFQNIGQPQKALVFYNQALPIFREVGDRSGEATTFNNIGLIYQSIGQPQKALDFLEKALPITQETGNRGVEATTLNNIGMVFQNIGQPQKALDFFEQALPILHETGNRAVEATTLNNIGMIYQSTGYPRKALGFFEQALPILHETENRAVEPTTLNNIGMVFQSTGQPKKALTFLEKALPITQETKNRSVEATTLNNIGMVFQNIGQTQKALAFFEKALPILHETKNRAGEAMTLCNIGLIFLNTGQPQKALNFLEQALPIMRETKNRVGEAMTLNNIGIVLQSTGQPQEALDFFEKTLPIMRETKNRAGEAMTLINIGMIYQSIGQPQKALDFYNFTLHISKETGDRSSEATTLNNIGMIYQSTGQPQKARAFFEKALPILHETGNRGVEATTLNNIGLVFQNTGQPQKALNFFEKALPIMREIKNRVGEAMTLNNIGMIYQSTGQLQKALNFLEKVLPIMRETKNRAGEAMTLNNIGMIYQSTGQPQKALDFYDLSLPISKEIGDRSGEATTLNNIGMIYQSTGQPQKALDFLEKALPITQETGNRGVEATTLNNIGMVFQNIGQPQKALDFFEQALPILHETGNRAVEATTLNNIGLVYFNNKQHQKSLQFLEQALQTMEVINNPSGEALVINNISFINFTLKNYTEALEFKKKAIIILQNASLPCDANGTTEAQIKEEIEILEQLVK